jgi:hypothetical protein
MYSKFILTKSDVISLITLLCELKRQVHEIKDPKISNDVLNFIYANSDPDDLELFRNINNIYNNIKYLELENPKQYGTNFIGK